MLEFDQNRNTWSYIGQGDNSEEDGEYDSTVMRKEVKEMKANMERMETRLKLIDDDEQGEAGNEEVG